MSFLNQDSRFLGLEDAHAGSDAQTVIVPVPFERTSSYGVGSARGPEAILQASQQVELRDVDLQAEPWALAGGIATREPLPVGDGNEALTGCDLSDMLQELVASHLDQEQFVVTLGGEHTSIVGAARAHLRRWPEATILQLDAHSDLREQYLGDAWNHACAMSRILDRGGHLVQVGIRSECEEDFLNAQKHQAKTLTARSIHQLDRHGESWMDEVVNACQQEVYITLDTDVFDPALVPDTGTPEPGGLTFEQYDRLLEKLCAERTVVGFDVSELAPVQHTSAFVMAKVVSRTIGRIHQVRSKEF